MDLKQAWRLLDPLPPSDLRTLRSKGDEAFFLPLVPHHVLFSVTSKLSKQVNISNEFANFFFLFDLLGKKVKEMSFIFLNSTLLASPRRSPPFPLLLLPPLLLLLGLLRVRLRRAGLRLHRRGSFTL